MKKFILLFIILFLLISCGKEDALELKKKDFFTKLKKLHTIGIDINKSQSNKEGASFLLNITDANKSANAILHFFGQYDATNEEKRKLAKVLDKIKYLKAQINWQKYAKDEPRSVFVYLPGKGDEKEPLKTLLKEKTFGAYLSFKNDQLKTIEIKDINKTINDKNGSVSIFLDGAEIAIEKMPSKKDSSSIMHAKVSQFNITANILNQNRHYQNKLNLSLQNLKCDSNKPVEYLGTISCSLPTLSMRVENKQDRINMHLANIKITSSSQAFNSKIAGKSLLSIDLFDVNNTNLQTPFHLHLEKLFFSLDMENINEQEIKKFYEFAKNPPKDQNKILQELVKFMQALFSNNVKMRYKATIKTIALKAGKKEGRFILNDFSEKGAVEFNTTINATDSLKIAQIQLYQANENLFELKNATINATIKNFYNFVPEFFAIAVKNANKPYNQPLSKEEEEAFSKIGQNIINQGFILSYNPISFDLLKTRDVTLHKSRLDFNITLAKNDYIIQKKVPPILLLAYLKSNGKLVLPKKDFEALITKFPPKFAAIAMMYAKMEKDNVVFEIKFKNGALYINGALLK